jgi:hypothetical protein
VVIPASLRPGRMGDIITGDIITGDIITLEDNTKKTWSNIFCPCFLFFDYLLYGIE